MNESVCFRREFQFDPEEWPGIRGVKLTLDSKMPSIEAWLNGKPLKLPPTGHGEVKLETDQLKTGRNVLAVRVSPSEGEEEAKKVSEKDIQRITYGANLFPRPGSGDEVLNKSQLKELGLFRQLKKMPGVEEFPNSIVLRKYAPGDVICFQGEPGHSAFYILTTEDLFRLRSAEADFETPSLKSVKLAELTPDRLREVWDELQSELRRLERESADLDSPQSRESMRNRRIEFTRDLVYLEDKLMPLADRMELLNSHEAALEKDLKSGRLKEADEKTVQAEKDRVRTERRAATVHIIPGANRVVQPKSWLGRISRRLFGGGGTPLDRSPTAIRNDGPSDVDYQTRQAPMFEGDLFGEMACMTNSPRSATITADGEVYMLEFLKNVFNLIQKDEGYREQILKGYRERVLSTHLDRLQFFQGLAPEQKATLSDALDLKIVDAGTVIFNEEEPSDCVYIIRTGLVQVVKGIRGVHVALNKEAVVDWQEFAQELLKGDPGLEIPCPECGHVLRLMDRKFLGQFGRCPDCRHKFLLEDPAKKKLEIELTSADSFIFDAVNPGGKKPISTKDKIAAMKAKAAQKKTAGDEAKPQSTKDKIAAMKAKAAQKKTAGEEAKPEATKDKIAAMKAKAAQKKKAGEEAKPEATKDKIAAMKAKAAGPKKAAGGGAAALLKKKAPAGPVKKGKKADPHAFQKAIWDALPERAQNAIRRVAGGIGQPGDEMQILVALNDLIKSRELIDAKNPNFNDLIANEKAIATYPRNRKQWTGLQICVAGRLILQNVYGKHLKKPADDQDAGPIRILAYLSSGDILGEMGVVQKTHRTATCIAWDHPTEEGKSREPGQVHLISIEARAFDELMRDPLLKASVEEMIRVRQEQDSRYQDEPAWQESSIITSPEFQDRGFIQGQKLMLIDLDSCTRCGDCVRACIETHDDGYSRLFLDGPRFDRFLVPSACRNCIDPACMIGCPVGSIQKGEAGQIVIRDWCIGCNKCANQCPYDSIQMHDTGLIPSRSPGWKFRVEGAVEGLNWYEPRYKDDAWSDGIGPFRWDLDFHGRMEEQKEAHAQKNGSAAGSGSKIAPSKFLKYQETVLEVRLDVDKLPPLPPGQESLDLDKLRLKALPAVAVVCDQCSTRKNGLPACVEHCPHEAAMRINARLEFPIGMKE